MTVPNRASCVAQAVRDSQLVGRVPVRSIEAGPKDPAHPAWIQICEDEHGTH